MFSPPVKTFFRSIVLKFIPHDKFQLRHIGKNEVTSAIFVLAAAALSENNCESAFFKQILKAAPWDDINFRF